MTLQSIAQSLTNYEIHEARSIIRILLEDSFGLSYTDILTGGIDRLPAEEKQRFHNAISQLLHGKPIQFVTQKVWFCGRLFHVEPGVLIPRPETEELCQWIIDGGIHGDILDVGTGSGCIAITLQKELSDSRVTGWDISDDALRIAQYNAAALHSDVTFLKQDALNIPSSKSASPRLCSKKLGFFAEWDAIVSNPPYICNRESVDMDRNVLDYEPSIALFVPDEDPLLFYRSIAEFSIHALRRNGALFFEINPLYANELTYMLSSIGFTDISLRKDAFGKERMIKCTRK